MSQVHPTSFKNFFLFEPFLGKSKQRNKKDAVKLTSEVNNEKPKQTVEKEATPTATSEAPSTEAERQPSIEPTTTKIESAQNDVTEQHTSSNHIDSNHVLDKPSANADEAMAVTESENDDDQTINNAVENGNLSGASSAPASKSSSQIKLKYQYPEGMTTLPFELIFASSVLLQFIQVETRNCEDS